MFLLQNREENRETLLFEKRREDEKNKMNERLSRVVTSSLREEPLLCWYYGPGLKLYHATVTPFSSFVSVRLPFLASATLLGQVAEQDDRCCCCPRFDLTRSPGFSCQPNDEVELDRAGR